MRKVDIQFVLLCGEQPESILDLTKLELEGIGNLDYKQEGMLHTVGFGNIIWASYPLDLNQDWICIFLAGCTALQLSCLSAVITERQVSEWAALCTAMAYYW